MSSNAHRNTVTFTQHIQPVPRNERTRPNHLFFYHKNHTHTIQLSSTIIFIGFPACKYILPLFIYVPLFFVCVRPKLAPVPLPPLMQPRHRTRVPPPLHASVILATSASPHPPPAVALRIVTTHPAGLRETRYNSCTHPSYTWKPQLPHLYSFGNLS